MNQANRVTLLTGSGAKSGLRVWDHIVAVDDVPLTVPLAEFLTKGGTQKGRMQTGLMDSSYKFTLHRREVPPPAPTQMSRISLDAYKLTKSQLLAQEQSAGMLAAGTLEKLSPRGFGRWQERYFQVSLAEMPPCLTYYEITADETAEQKGKVRRPREPRRAPSRRRQSLLPSRRAQVLLSDVKRIVEDPKQPLNFSVYHAAGKVYKLRVKQDKPGDEALAAARAVRQKFVDALRQADVSYREAESSRRSSTELADSDDEM